ncbi:type II toxin-antitoxin system PemK/MazF family toxin [Pantoea ananatis]|uniref:type II toxin-antitoxin system PemK/MazF family toxin n=1 Tax=Pantoea ananas TaxID=553 RepID=UPI001B312CAE|nr:type II toxin-antitoxin system PemK/MazF family toxin [Pantoea ananatis]
MALKIDVLPKVGDILWCFFPITMGSYRPKARPAIVTGVSQTKHEVIVVFGTSQKTDKIYESEFLISKLDGTDPFTLSGLSYDTKFDFNRESILPFTTEFFARAPKKNNIPFPKLGSVHIMYFTAMKNAKKTSQDT